MESKLINGDSLVVLKDYDENSIDLLCTDPPYGYGFMGKDWDQTLPPREIFEECLRVLKPGSFAFVMSAPRSDVQSRMVKMLEEVGFDVSFTPIYWAYATGFPKAMNIGKAVDKRLGVEREVVGKEKIDIGIQSGTMHSGRPTNVVERDKTVSTSDEAKKLDGSYAGYQPKPAVEVVIVAMKPLEKKGYLDQALDNQKGITWLDDARIPFAGMSDTEQYDKDNVGSQKNFDTEAGGLSRGNQPARKSKSDTYERISAFGDSDQSETNDGRNLWGKKSTKKVKITKRKPRNDYEKYVEKQKSFKGAKTIGKVHEGGTTFLGGDIKQKNPAETYQRKTTTRKPREENTVFKTSGFKSEDNDTADASPFGRFAANLLVSDDVLDTGKKTKSSGGRSYQNTNDMFSGGWAYDEEGTGENPGKGDEGDFSRYYSLDEWWKHRMSRLPEEVRNTFPFLIVPKASTSEKNMGLEGMEEKQRGMLHIGQLKKQQGEVWIDRKDGKGKVKVNRRYLPQKNNHPTVKPIQLFSYLVTLGSRKDDVVLDPFMGSGTTPISCVTLDRKYLGIEREKEYFEIAEARVERAINPANLVKHDFF